MDDHALIREGIARAVADEHDLEVVGEAGSVAAAMEAARELRPDLVVLDLALGSADGLDLIGRLRRTSDGARILVLSMFDEAVYAERCLRAGASGYVMKEEASETLIDAVREVLGGGMHVSPDVARRLDRGGGREHLPAGVEGLTDRELQVFRMLGEGRSTREVADGLHLSVKTVETHRAKIMRKLGLHHASELVHRAVSWVREQQGMP